MTAAAVLTPRELMLLRRARRAQSVPPRVRETANELIAQGVQLRTSLEALPMPHPSYAEAWVEQVQLWEQGAGQLRSHSPALAAFADTAAVVLHRRDLMGGGWRRVLVDYMKARVDRLVEALGSRP